MNTLTFQHQDGDMTFPVRSAWFVVTSANALTFSIQCAANRAYDWMSIPSFCLEDFPLTEPLAEGLLLQFAGHDPEVEGDGPRSFAYVGEHELPRDVEVLFKRVAPESCDIELSWSQPDVDFYDERAKPNRVAGACTLLRGKLKDIWIPG